jgi:hypothetical protein
MKLIDEGYDSILDVEYELRSGTMLELKNDFKDYTSGLSLENFDRSSQDKLDEREYKIIKDSAIISNYFYAYRDHTKLFLVDGFSRLFVKQNLIDDNAIVYLKVIKGPITNNKLMRIMTLLNLWKLSSNTNRETNIKLFFDRGFRLLLFKLYGLTFQKFKCIDSKHHWGDKNDLDIIQWYFIKEFDTTYYHYEFNQTLQLLTNAKFIDDLTEILKVNSYDLVPFNNFEDFFNGFMTFLARNRLRGNMSEIKFETYLQLLKQDTKYFNALQKMCGNDMTRRNIFKWFKQFEVDNK